MHVFKAVYDFNPTGKGYVMKRNSKFVPMLVIYLGIMIIGISCMKQMTNPELSDGNIQVPMGIITGTVQDTSHQQGIKDVLVEVIKNSAVVTQDSTDVNGEYSVEVEVDSIYRLQFSHPDYISAFCENISVNSETIPEIVDNIILVPKGSTTSTDTGSVSGTILNATNYIPVDSLFLQIRSGINAETGPVLKSVATDSLGRYKFSGLEAGNYTIQVSGDGYITIFFTVICIGGQDNSNQNFAITPVLNANEIRIILTWTESPKDLDAHLTGPRPNGGRFHVWYREKVYVDTNASGQVETFAELDLDDLSSYGPETVTIYDQIDGTYRFSVHDYTNRSSESSTALSNSGAQVRIYKGSGLLETFNVPTNMGGTLWTVFEMNGTNIVQKQVLSYESSGSLITGTDEGTDEYLFRNMPKKK